MRVALFQPNPKLLQVQISWLARLHLLYWRFEKLADLTIDLRCETFDLAIIEWQGNQFPLLNTLDRLRRSGKRLMPILITTRPDLMPRLSHVFQPQACATLSHPIDFDQWMALILRLLKDSQPDNLTGRMDFGGYLFHPRTNQIRLPTRLGYHLVDMTRKEFELALLLFRNIDRNLSRSYVLDLVWGPGMHLNSRTMDTHISRIRQKLVLQESGDFRVAPIYGFGYRLEEVSSAWSVLNIKGPLAVDQLMELSPSR